MMFDWQERSVLVVGASSALAGFVVKELLGRGAAVHCTVKDWVPQSLLVRDGLLSDVTVCQTDDSDPDGLCRALADFRVDTVFHVPDAPRSGESAPRTFEAHVASTWTLLDAAVRVGSVKTVVLAGAERLGSDLPPVFDAARECAGEVARYYADAHGLGVATTRTPAIYGPGDLNWSGLIPATIRAALRSRPLVLEGQPEDVFHCVYARDAARAHVRLAEALHLGNAQHGGTFRIPEGAHLTTAEVVTRVLSVMGSRLSPVFHHREAGNPERGAREAVRLDSVPAQRIRSSPPHLASFQVAPVPTFAVETDFDTGVREAVSWYETLLKSPAANSSRPAEEAA
jgi:CDP-glucose 4,6-dehydratase